MVRNSKNVFSLIRQICFYGTENCVQQKHWFIDSPQSEVRSALGDGGGWENQGYREAATAAQHLIHSPVMTRLLLAIQH